MAMRGFAATALSAILFLALACGCGGQKQAVEEEPRDEYAQVPEEYRDIYVELEAKLSELNRHLDEVQAGETRDTVFSVELVTANANRGESLLEPMTLHAIAKTLDRLQDIGVTGITLSVNYPLLNADFPRSPEYIDFYRRVATMVKARGFALIVETTTVFPNPEISGLGVDYAGLTLDQYISGKRAMAETIIRELAPDYLTVENEPGTQRSNTGLDLSVANQTAVVNGILSGLDRSGTRIGAGAGSWDNLAYFESLAANTSLDYLDVHFYPIQGDLVIDRAERIAEIARSGSKDMAVSECWLYKASSAELASGQDIATAADTFARDAYGFWAPLDQDFLEVMVKLSRHLELEFMSPFWMQYLFAYLDYDPAMAEQGYAWVQKSVANRTRIEIQAGNLSPTGEAYRDLISGD
ncbi:MAG: hypothetical protein HPY75_02690 [Actinobacteria bacterium]|nr:hypothetical protein [Actinomycetota bacterium]